MSIGSPTGSRPASPATDLLSRTQNAIAETGSQFQASADEAGTVTIVRGNDKLTVDEGISGADLTAGLNQLNAVPAGQVKDAPASF